MAKNTTLGRKESNDMKKNEGFYAPTRRQDQSGDGADFAFNGQMGNGVNRIDGHYNGRHAGNQAGMMMKENYGEKAFARRGNTSDQSQDRMEKVGPSATRDAMKATISTAAEGHNLGKTEVKRFKNADSIYMGK